MAEKKKMLKVTLVKSAIGYNKKKSNKKIYLLFVTIWLYLLLHSV